MAAKVLAVAIPKSLRAMISTSMPAICLSILMRSSQVNGSATPVESAYPKRLAPAAFAALAKSMRNPRSALDASSATQAMYRPCSFAYTADS